MPPQWDVIAYRPPRRGVKRAPPTPGFHSEFHGRPQPLYHVPRYIAPSASRLSGDPFLPSHFNIWIPGRSPHSRGSTVRPSRWHSPRVSRPNWRAFPAWRGVQFQCHGPEQTNESISWCHYDPLPGVDGSETDPLRRSVCMLEDTKKPECGENETSVS